MKLVSKNGRPTLIVKAKNYMLFRQLLINLAKVDWVIVSLVWMGVIFWFSSQPARLSAVSSKQVYNALSIFGIFKYVFSILNIRKVAHFILYFVLQVFVFNAIGKLTKYNSLLKTCISSIVVCIIYAMTDEIHQMFVIGRSAQIKDVFIDTQGALLSMFILLLIVFYEYIVNRKMQQLY